MSLALHHVVKSYADTTAVKGLSFEVERGEIFGLIGPNGAGKTTTMRMIIGMIKPDEGWITWLGEPLQASFNDRIGYMPEERGLYRRSRVLDDKDRRVVAYHEAGRALVMEEISKTEAVGKITIVSRGQSLGYVMPLPDEDKNLRSRTEYEDSIAGLLAGRAAEEMIFNEPSTRAATDLERVTKVAKAMVTRFGMSDVIGPVQLQHGDANPFMGMDIGEQRAYSEDVARKIDREVRRIVDDAYTRAKDILQHRRDQLVLIAETLLEKEVLDRQEFLQLIGKGSSPQAAAAAAD